MPTQNISLTPKLADFVRERVESGSFKSASEVHRAALRVFEQAEEKRSLYLKHLEEQLSLGVSDLKEGRYKSIISTEAHQTFFEKIEAGLTEDESHA